MCEATFRCLEWSVLTSDRWYCATQYGLREGAGLSTAPWKFSQGNEVSSDALQPSLVIETVTGAVASSEGIEELRPFYSPAAPSRKRAAQAAIARSDTTNCRRAYSENSGRLSFV